LVVHKSGIGFVFRFRFGCAVVKRQRAHGVGVRLFHPPGEKNCAQKDGEEQADGDDAVSADAADVFENILDPGCLTWLLPMP